MESRTSPGERTASTGPEQTDGAEAERIDGADAESTPTAELTSPKAKLVYLYLRTEGEAAVEEMRRDLGLKLLSLYPILGELARAGVVQRRGPTYVAR